LQAKYILLLHPVVQIIRKSDPMLCSQFSLQLEMVAAYLPHLTFKCFALQAVCKAGQPPVTDHYKEGAFK